MNEKIQVDLDEVKQLFFLLEEYVAFFHQPMHYENIDAVNKFLEAGMYKRLHNMFYHTVWDWLPPSVKEEIENRPSPHATSGLDERGKDDKS